MGFREKFDEVKNNPDFTLKELLGFASGSFGNSMGQDCVGTYTDQFFYDYMGLNSAQNLTLKSVTKGVNIISSPIIGLLLDNRGNAKKFMTMSAIPLTVSSVLLFFVPTGSITFRLIWSFLLFLLFNVADTFYDISLLTMSSRMTTSPGPRKTFYTVAQFASTLGSTLPGGLVPFIIDIQKGDYNSEKWAFFVVALIFGILGLITMIVPCLTLQEKLALSPEVKEKKAAVDLKVVLLNRPLLLLSLSQIIDSVRQVCYYALPFFYKQTMNNYSMKTVVEVCSSTLSYIGLASVPVIGKKLSSRDMVSYGYLLTGICYTLLSIFGYKYKIIVGALIAIGGFPNAGMGAARRILLADSADYMEWKSYKKLGISVRNEGMIFSFNTMCSRISSLWKDLMIDIGLSMIGYKSATVDANGNSVEAVQTPETLKGIFYLVVIPGIIGNIIPGLIMRFDDFNGKKKESILKELEEIRKERLEVKNEA
ncbi:MAG: MFS transporter [Ruminococcaceae bacterium]|nr:MFS transporter [Oscillospiraceae bacterium]